MNPATFDLEALVRALILSLGCGFIVAAVGFFVMRPRGDWIQRRPVLMMGVGGGVLVLTLVTYYLWPTLVVVPLLDHLGQAEAEQLLTKRKLVANATPQFAAGTEPGRVIPKSQQPMQGLPVKPGTVVSFSVSVSVGGPPNPPQLPPGSPSASLFEPKSGETLHCVTGGDAIFRCSIRGASSGSETSSFRLLLWIKPVNPPSDQPGWYLQRPPGNGISSIDKKGSWFGVAQLGNALYPPREGDTVDVAVSVADAATVQELMAERGVVVRDHPLGVNSDIASGVIVSLKR